ncbi:SDR family NAD(P)-dependent oxidoreductase [Microbulbifer halophilus]|uniref:SDR family NAD(P)-dependent oxidoreductase n=1 Tax=Microbulbifer halophilus TaxID=453963 RepID=A0ABW5E7G3_9GAMM|nr:glucose 1-dehydrogenase [Microbulbifer halophilus]MCW8125840.1 glucose 1-dehydrogenase [Microbulbifer halophilus]
MNNTTPTSHSTLQGRVAIVTGASSGIGRASALELAARGARVVAAARREQELEQLVAEIRNGGGEALAVRTDITRESDIEQLVATTLAEYGALDILFNNAGTEGTFAPLLEQTAETYDQVFEPNVRGAFLAMKHAGKVMQERGSGSIINNASMGGVIGFENGALYIASKHAVLGMTKTASIEWFRRGVRVNALCPGVIDTAMTTDRIWPSAEAMREFARDSIAGRAGSPGEMANIVAFLASDDASFISGHGLLADGGYSIA